MSLFLVTLAAAALGGGFTVYPWSGGGHSRIHTVIAIVLWAVGAVLAGVAGYLDHKRRKEPKDGDRPPAVDPRESLKKMLVDEYHEGVAINHRPRVDEMKRDAPPWQTKVVALLRDSLVNDCWIRFERMGPNSGRKLNNQLWDQTRYLGEILQNFAEYDLKATWRPPTPGR